MMDDTVVVEWDVDADASELHSSDDEGEDESSRPDAPLHTEERGAAPLTTAPRLPEATLEEEAASALLLLLDSTLDRRLAFDLTDAAARSISRSSALTPLLTATAVAACCPSPCPCV